MEIRVDGTREMHEEIEDPESEDPESESEAKRIDDAVRQKEVLDQFTLEAPLLLAEKRRRSSAASGGKTRDSRLKSSHLSHAEIAKEDFTEILTEEKETDSEKVVFEKKVKESKTQKKDLAKANEPEAVREMSKVRKEVISIISLSEG